MNVDPQPTVPILNIAWTRYAQLDALSNKHSKPHYRWRRWISILGVLAALFAVITQVYSDYMPATLGWVLKFLLIATPLTASVLAAFVNKFYNGRDWLVSRAGAEEILKEIYMYRAFFKNKLDRREWLEKRLANIQRQVYRGMSGELVLNNAPEKIPPYYNPDDPNSDPGFKDLTGSEYVKYRLENQLAWHIRKVQQFEVERTRLQVYILVAGGLGALLAALGEGFSIWVAVTASLGAALIGWQELRNLDPTIKNYSKVIMELMIIYDRWSALEPEERTDAEFFQMVKSTEDVLWSQNIEYIKSMQEVLARETLEEAELINDVLKKAIESDAAFKKHMRYSVVSFTSQSMDEARGTLEEHFDQTLGSLAEEASSELVQQELAAIEQAAQTAVAFAAETVKAGAARLSDSLKAIADEFAGVDIGRDTPKEVLNDLLSRYPTTEEVKG
ncbi:MAG: SLATT domain-containing protein [Anaerolineales bacterium]|nr:SLATT domain-containing protein [Anaerolineales bacterium]